ncbi:putative Ras guanyl-nucleotide exchange factor RasGEF [Aspergillus undulatus]|uniref:putative Ras guanyl-nucleotide exchange factor RasGEF n=1 Tax=Aspergillus undulatus TaxID=1810928 RepID=UPI003CCD5980
MASQPSRRERASSDRAQAAPVPQRPGLPSRTISAPPGGLYKIDSGRAVMEGGSTVDRTLIEEDEGPIHSGGNGISSPQVGNETISRSSFPHVSIAVVGGDKVGKTTFIQSALEMKHPLSSRSTTKKMSLDGSVYVVRLVKVQTDEIPLDSNGKLRWPQLGNDSPSTVEGALLLHDATRPTARLETMKMIDAFAAASIPFVLVATKCDKQSPDEPLETSFGSYDIHRTSPDSPQKQKLCIAVILRDVLSQKDVIAEKSPNSSSTSQEWHHTRARSENPTSLLAGAAGGPFSSALDPGVDGYGVDRHPTDSKTSPNLASNAQGSRYARSNSQPVRPHTPPSRLNPHRTLATADSSPGKDLSRQPRLHTGWRNSGGPDTFNSFLDMEDELDISRSAPSSPESKDKASSESSSNETGFTFDELVDRLVAQPMSKQDSKFASIFLCLYRKFAAPATLLNALINRFERNEKNITDQLTRIADQLRLLNVIAQWVSEYAGDLAYPKTRKRIVDFVATLERSHFYMFAAKEIGSYLEVNAEDDDVGWAFKDGEAETIEGPETFFDHSARSSLSMFLGGFSYTNEGDEEEQEEEDPIYNMSALDLSEGIHDQPGKLSATLSNPPALEKPGTIPSQSFTFLSIDAAQKEAAGMELVGRVPLTKMVWRQLMEIPDEDFANELTRIDWIMFNTFRPRDLVRHVSISGPDKDKIQSLKHVNRMIKQFNHVAFFVASIILLRDKPKHRARALEKFMNIAQKLRRLNNYNSLGAVIAGINGTPVHRLGQTRELVPAQAQKAFMRLVILMGTQKSHFAYRLAWDNSFSERIPFLPLHRRDLVSAEEGNRTFIGDNRMRINWKKFEVMGEVVLGIQRSQKTPYPHLHRYDEVAKLILDTKLSGDDEMSTTAKSTYRAILRELPRRSLNNRTPLHNRIREHFQKFTSTGSSGEGESETLRQLQQAGQFAQYAKAQRTYAALVDRYNPGSLMDEEERVRLTARRVGLDLPELHTEKGKKGEGEGDGDA